MIEKVARFGNTKSIVGILTEPQEHRQPSRLPAVILFNAGFIHRVGPNRIHVKLARKLAVPGFCTLRFDLSGIGDSDRRNDNRPAEISSVHETQQAMDYIESTQGIRRFLLAGICSGADMAVTTACHDQRVVGVAAVNGTFMDKTQPHHVNRFLENSIRRRYYRKYFLDPHRWWKLLAGKTHRHSLVKSFIGRMQDLHAAYPPCAPLQIDASTECRLLLDRGVNLFLIYSEGSSALDAFHLTLEPGLASWRSSGKLTIERVKDADHVFTLLWSQELLIDLIQQWACRTWTEPVRSDLHERVCR